MFVDIIYDLFTKLRKSLLYGRKFFFEKGIILLYYYDVNGFPRDHIIGSASGLLEFTINIFYV